MPNKATEIALLCDEAKIDPDDILNCFACFKETIKLVDIFESKSEIRYESWKDLIAILEIGGALKEVEGTEKPPEERLLHFDSEKAQELLKEAKIIFSALPDLKKQYHKDTQYRIAATIPSRLDNLLRFFNAFENTPFGIRRMASEAERKLYILVPFIDYDGLNEVSQSLKGALDRGVSINILTRNLTEGHQNYDALVRIFGDPILPKENFHLYETVSEDGLSLSHAKVLSRDNGKEVYIGSANFTRASMEKTIEVGVFLRGRQAEPIDGFIQLVLSHSIQRWP